MNTKVSSRHAPVLLRPNDAARIVRRRVAGGLVSRWVWYNYHRIHGIVHIANLIAGLRPGSLRFRRGVAADSKKREGEKDSLIDGHAETPYPFEGGFRALESAPETATQLVEHSQAEPSHAVEKLIDGTPYQLRRVGFAEHPENMRVFRAASQVKLGFLSRAPRGQTFRDVLHVEQTY